MSVFFKPVVPINSRLAAELILFLLILEWRICKFLLLLFISHSSAESKINCRQKVLLFLFIY